MIHDILIRDLPLIIAVAILGGILSYLLYRQTKSVAKALLIGYGIALAAGVIGTLIGLGAGELWLRVTP